MANTYVELAVDGYEKVMQCQNDSVGFTAWIAVHNTARGPALGGCRVWRYSSDEAGLSDVLRLGRGMTYKNALAQLPLGGGKSVINADIRTIDRAALFEAMGEFVDQCCGEYIIAEDVNSTVDDMAIVMTRTSHVATVGGSGNPSPFTAYGVLCGIKASVFHKWGIEDISGLRIAIQGAGETGGRLARMLHDEGCQLIVADINQANLKNLAATTPFETVDPDQILAVKCDVFAPCALGGILNEKSIPHLRCGIVAGSANNQLQSEVDGRLLHQRNILYAPDYAINAGGVINISCEIGQPYCSNRAKTRTEKIAATLREIYQLSADTDIPTSQVADMLALDFLSTRLAA